MPFSPVYRGREIARYTCIRGFTGRQQIKSGVFDSTTLTAQTLAPPTTYVTIWGAQGTIQYYVPVGSFLSASTTDPTKIKVYQGLGTNANDVQTLTTTGTPTGGTFTLTFNGQTTTALVYNASAATIATALAALTSIGNTNNIAATGGALPGTAVTLTFGALLGNSPQNLITVNYAGLTGGTTPAMAVTHTTPGTAAEQIIGVFDGPDKDYYGNTSIAFDEAVPIYFHAVSFDVSKLQNWDQFGVAAKAALPNCTFY